MFMLDVKDTGWWYWVASTTCLWLAVTVYPAAFQIALLIGVVQLLHFIITERSVSAFPVQVRAGYFCFLLLAIPEGLQWLLWVPAVGTLARVLTGYCIMARHLMLLPMNRNVQLTMGFIKEAFLTPPMQGNILHGLPALKKSN